MITNVLLTGASGFIGSHILDQLLDDGYKVTSLIRSKSSKKWIEGKNTKIVVSDFVNYENIKDELKDIEVVIHVAGIIAALDYKEFYVVNSEGTRILLDAVANYSDKFSKFIYISSQTVGGPATSLDNPIDESDKVNPLTSYAKSKFEAENFVIHNKYGINYSILRPAAVFGERDPGILQIFKMVKKGLAPLIGLDNKYLNLIYVKDLVKAAISCIDNPLSNNQIYYIAGKEVYNWNFLMDKIKVVIDNKNAIKIKVPNFLVLAIGYINEIISKIIGKPQIFNYDKAIDFTRKYWVCNSSKARNDIGLETNEDIGYLLDITAKWYMKNGWL